VKMLNPALCTVALLLLVTTTGAQRVRLVGGPSPGEGRLEVYYHGRWGTVCDDYFTESAARVVCYQLGYRRSGRFIGNRYGAGSGRIWLDDVQCRGTETNIGDCRHRDWGIHDCGHGEDVSVSCITVVRLVGGSYQREGRLEVYHNGVWGTVCLDYFNDAAAKVVCNMLGYGYIGWNIGTRYGAGSGPIWLDDVQCNGTEMYISHCRHNGWGRHNCDHSNDVSVSCKPTAMRLAGGVSPYEGRLEVYHNGTWGTVCDDHFNNEAAKVVCSVLTGGHAGHFIGNRYGAGSGPIWMDNVQCYRTENDISDCQHNGWGSHNCTHSQDVSVSCPAARLVGSSRSQERRLEVHYNGTWMTPYINDAAARVVCYMLGYGYNGQRIINGTRTSYTLVFYCSGYETNIQDCPRYHRYHYPTTVSCTSSVRLAGSSNPREGRLEVYHNRTWGTVCHDHFNSAAARVVCHMLGYGGHVGQLLSNRYGAGSGPIWLDDLQCSGTETDIANCRHNGWGNHTCMHRQDVSVSCPVAPRLVGYGNLREGRLEVYHNGTWGTVCDDYFNDAAVSVVCYMLGFGYVGQVIGNRYGAGSGPIWLDGIQCNGTEENLFNCPNRGWGRHDCEHDEDVSVSCYKEVRLIGDSRLKGRVEVYHNGTWGTVCDDYFNDAAARIVCYMLGFGYAGHVIGNRYGAGSGPIWLDDIQCNGTEGNIFNCPNRGWGSHDCVHNEDVSVLCANEVRLVGDSRLKGRLEVYHNGTWGTVCDDSFNGASARVVCYMLGFGYVGQVIGNRYGAGSGPIWLDDVQCSGTETDISQCRHNGWGRHSCTHNEDVSVSCPTVRLIGGASPLEGRLEVYYNDTWGTVCNDAVNGAAARVICYMLGYGHVGRFVNKPYGAAKGRIWINNILCNGTEADIAYCRHNGRGAQSCTHRNDVSVSCINARLVGSSRPTKGRLEVQYNGTWGTVCDNGFTDAAARVVCYSLRYGHVGRVIGNAFGAGSGRIWLDNVRCSGTELSIVNCQHKGWGRHNCQHNDDVSVSCIADSAEAVALVGGNPRVGRLEVFRANQWGTVCDNGFTDAAARVVCYSLGFGYVGRKVNISLFGMGDGLIWFDNVNCTGTEQHIGECSRDDWGVYNCEHRNDVAVSCTDNTSTTLSAGVRLIGGSSSRGLLEVLHNGVWGTVCGDYFTDAAALVVCKMLGFATGTKVANIKYIVDHGPVWLEKLQCTGTERDIAECSHNGWGIHNCKHRDDVAVSCTGTKLDQVRLNGGRDPREGRLEVFFSGVWRAVCRVSHYGYRFNYASARVVCNMMGFKYIGTAINNNFGVSVAAAVEFVTNQCRGTERSITDCSQVITTYRRCQSVAVSCLPNNAVTLVGGGTPREGRLELYTYRNRTWGTVCDDKFTDAAARVVCYSLGFGRVGYKVNINTYGIGSGAIWLDDVECRGWERHISECSHRWWGVHNCGHNEDVAVSCVSDKLSTSSVLSSRITSQMTSSATMIVNFTTIQSTHHTTQSSSTVVPCPREGSIALIGGRRSREGRVQVCHNGIWGTVCEDGFNNPAARVVCYSLGFGYIGYKVNINIYGIGEGVIWLDDIQCNGSERHISECSHRGWGVHNCVHKEDVAIFPFYILNDMGTEALRLRP